MIESGRVASELPRLDRTDDPRGGAAAWALLAITMALTIGVILMVICVTQGR